MINNWNRLNFLPSIPMAVKSRKFPIILIEESVNRGFRRYLSLFSTCWSAARITGYYSVIYIDIAVISR